MILKVCDHAMFRNDELAAAILTDIAPSHLTRLEHTCPIAEVAANSPTALLVPEVSPANRRDLLRVMVETPLGNRRIGHRQIDRASPVAAFGFLLRGLAHQDDVSPRAWAR